METGQEPYVGEETANQVRHLVVVDDEPAIREICADMLSSEGYQVSTAGNGQEAVDLVAQKPVDLVLMDIMMPVMDGVSACKMLKANARTRDIPVIIMSAAHNLRERTGELQCVAAAIVPKPFDLDHLVETVRRLIAAADRARGLGAV